MASSTAPKDAKNKPRRGGLFIDNHAKYSFFLFLRDAATETLDAEYLPAAPLQNKKTWVVSQPISSSPLRGLLRDLITDSFGGFLLLATMLSFSAIAADKSGVSPNAISVPKGPGSIEGLGDSFQPSLNTGTAKY